MHLTFNLPAQASSKKRCEPHCVSATIVSTDAQQSLERTQLRVSYIGHTSCNISFKPSSSSHSSSHKPISSKSKEKNTLTSCKPNCSYGHAFKHQPPCAWDRGPYIKLLGVSAPRGYCTSHRELSQHDDKSRSFLLEQAQYD